MISWCNDWPYSIAAFLRATLYFCLFQTTNRLTDVVIANNNMVDGGRQLGWHGQMGRPHLRTVGAARFVFVDNRLVGNTPDGYQNFRIHGTPGGPKAEYFYIARNQFEGTGHYFPALWVVRHAAGEVIENVYYVNNTQYCNYMSPINVHPTDPATGPQALLLPGNTLYSFGGRLSVQSVRLFMGCPGNTTSGYQAPPPWNFK